MYTQLGEAELKSGERMEIGVVVGPDAEWRPRLTAFLGHKGEVWLPQVEGALSGPLDGLESRFYAGRVDGRLVCHTMVAGSRGAAIFGHVLTAPQDRRKGAIHALLRVLMDDCSGRFQVMTLGTEFDSPAYRIYRQLGFRGVAEGSGYMVWRAEGTRDFFEPRTAVTVRPMRWDDWGHMNLLALQPVGPDEALPRSLMLGLKGQGSVEGQFLQLQARRAHEHDLQALVLESESGAVAGWALIGRDAQWFGDHLTLDLHAHPSFAGGLDRLANAMDWPGEPVVSYVTAPGGTKMRALEAAGFRQLSRLAGWICSGGRRDVIALRRDAAG